MIRPMLSLSASLALIVPAAAFAQTASPAVEKVTVRAVANFDFDRAALREEDRAALLAEVAQMKDVTWQTVTATGHTDSVGTADYNKVLAARRADSVRRYLLDKGLDATMVRSQAAGAEQPVADNTSEQGRAKNRRTEVRFEGVRPANR